VASARLEARQRQSISFETACDRRQRWCRCYASKTWGPSAGSTKRKECETARALCRDEAASLPSVGSSMQTIRRSSSTSLFLELWLPARRLTHNLHTHSGGTALACNHPHRGSPYDSSSSLARATITRECASAPLRQPPTRKSGRPDLQASISRRPAAQRRVTQTIART